MNDAFAVRGLQSAGDLQSDPDCVLGRLRTVERRAFDVFHHKVIGPHVVERANVRMIQGSDRASFLFEARAVLAEQDLDGDRPAQPGIDGFVDFAHPACAQERDDFIWTETSPWKGRHGAQNDCSSQFPPSRRVEMRRAGSKAGRSQDWLPHYAMLAACVSSSALLSLLRCSPPDPPALTKAPIRDPRAQAATSA